MATRTTFLNAAKTRAHEKGLTLLSRKAYFGVENASAGDVFEMLQLLSGDIVFAAWANVISKGDSNATIDLGYGTDPDYFGNAMPVDALGHCRTMLTGSLTWDAPEVADGIEETNEIEIDGARFGDHVTVSSGMDLADMSLTGEVISNNNIAVHLLNLTGGTLDLASQVIDVAVNKAPQMGSPLILSASDTIDITANDALTQGIIEVSALIFRK